MSVPRFLPAFTLKVRVTGSVSDTAILRQPCRCLFPLAFRFLSYSRSNVSRAGVLRHEDFTHYLSCSCHLAFPHSCIYTRAGEQDFPIRLAARGREDRG